ncbi:MAG: abortive infection family protein [Gemmatimonadales bacterium]|nr:abortive infection family protein [Gammaproteobacteria bacterium]MYC88938.1 abortive infection family protein [Candidatus Palauibacter denitrificans]
MARLVDDGQDEVKRQPTHYELEAEFRRSRVLDGDPNQGGGRPVGKAKRVRGVLSWALEHDPRRGERLVYLLAAMIRAKGGFRPTSPNFVGQEAVRDARDVFREEGYDLGSDGSLVPVVLDSLFGSALTSALRAYVRRAKRGANDAALVTGTGKDLVEATAKHVLTVRFGDGGHQTNFRTLLGQAFIAVDLAFTWAEGDPAHQRVEAALFELDCAVNMLRNKEGVGHGRPFPTTVTEAQSRAAIESMGLVAELLLNALEKNPE